MCLSDTLRRTALIATVLAPSLLQTFPAFGQTPSPNLAWRRIAGTSIREGLAGPATGPVRAVWYAAGTRQLLAQTDSDRVFETNDFTRWRLNTTAAVPQTATVQTAGSRLYAAGTANIYASDDAGRTWLNLTAFNDQSIIGGGFTSLAVSPTNPQEITAANKAGVWRSLDGGLSWQGLNEELPNLPVRRLLGKRVARLTDGTLIEVNAATWTTNEAGSQASADPDLALRSRLEALTKQSLTAAADGSSILYAGTADGRLLASADGGSTWTAAPPLAGAQHIDRIWVDATRPASALAAAGTRLLRTVNGGLFWDDVTGSLPEAAIHGVTADRSANTVYVATDRGVFSGVLSLNDAGEGASAWKSISQELPAAPAWDVLLNADNTLTVALDGYGVFETAAPHQTRNIRVVSGADLTERPAAPGSLISVLGAAVASARLSQGATVWPVLASSAESSQVQVPFATAPGSLSLSLEAGGNTWTVPLVVKDAAPAIFVDSEGSPLILDTASGLVMDPGVAIHAGTAIGVMATGLGRVTPDWPSGVPAPLESTPVVAGQVTAFLDGVPVTVTSATLAPGYVGYYMVQLEMPAIVNRGVSELRIVMNGIESNRVKLYLEP
jgi:uncharacterized protein (TIGR03437 family)